jgi:hypothetical protein
MKTGRDLKVLMLVPMAVFLLMCCLPLIRSIREWLAQ